MFIAAQIFRVFAAFFSILGDHADNPKKLYIYNGIGNFLASIQYALLGAFSGAVSSMAAILRNLIFYKNDTKKPIVALIIYLLFICLLNVPTFDGLISILPTIMVVLYTISIYRGNMVHVRYVVIFTCFLEIIYDIYYSAYVGIIVCIVDIILITIKLIRDKSSKNLKISV